MMRALYFHAHPELVEGPTGAELDRAIAAPLPPRALLREFAREWPAGLALFALPALILALVLVTP